MELPYPNLPDKFTEDLKDEEDSAMSKRCVAGHLATAPGPCPGLDP